MKINQALRAAVSRRRLERKKIGDLSVSEFREVMFDCLRAYDNDVESQRQRAGLSSGYEQAVMQHQNNMFTPIDGRQKAGNSR